MEMLDVAVVGAGISGLALANSLHQVGLKVAVFEKAAGSGGRLSSKKLVTDQGESFTVDIGAPFLQARSPAFRRQLSSWESEGLIEQLDYCLHFVGVPRSSMLTRKMCAQLDVHFGTRVCALSKGDDHWALAFDKGELAGQSIQAKSLVLTSPPPQSRELLPTDHPAQSLLADIEMVPRWIFALVVKTNLDDNDVLSELSARSEIDSVSIESGKPGRQVPGGYKTLVIHMADGWSEKKLEEESGSLVGEVKALMSSQLGGLLSIVHVHPHRWRYALAPRPLGDALPFYWGRDGLGLCGDGFGQEQFPGVERAWLSALALSRQMKESLKRAKAVGSVTHV